MSIAIVWLTIFVLAVFVGIEVISKVSTTLHTPLMSGANAIHGIILIGAVLVTGTTDSAPVLALGLVAVVLASINMVGGFVVTDRMLEMFRGKKRPRPLPAAGVESKRVSTSSTGVSQGSTGVSPGSTGVSPGPAGLSQGPTDVSNVKPSDPGGTPEGGR